MKPEEYSRHDALGLADLVRRGEATAVEICDATIARIEALNPTLNAVISRRFDQARAEARRVAPGDERPFAGVPVLLKGLVQSHRDLPSMEGSRFLAQHRPGATSELAARMEAAGAIVLGQTNVPELGLLATTEPELFGPTRNPWDLTRSTGGSSGGSAAAVASGMVPIAHGGDGGGSLRIPASCCGLFGLKPSRGRNPPGPAPYYHALCGLLLVEHVLTRSVRDSAAMLDATSRTRVATLLESPPADSGSFLAALDQPPPRLRCALLEGPLFNQAVDPACRAGVQAAGRLLGDLGHVVEPIDKLPVDIDALREAFMVLYLTDAAHVIERFCQKLGRGPRSRELEPVTWVLRRLGREIGGVELTAAIARVQDAQWAMVGFHAAHDILVSPVLAAPPPPLGSDHVSGLERALIRLFHRALMPPATTMIRRRTWREAFEWVGYTQLVNMTGAPAMSVPLHWMPQGLPVGIHMSSAFGREALLLSLAAQLEAAAPWAHRRPPDVALSDL
jgi:amidase